MFSKEVIRHAEACRFCWMCRHICPVAGSTGNESWTPRAKGLLISMIERNTEFDAGIADVMYHCTFCDACANDCVAGFRPSDFVRAARTQALVEGHAPAVVTETIDRIMEYGNIFGAQKDVVYPSAEAAEVLLYLGQTIRGANPTTGIAVAEILKKAGVAVQIMEDEPVSGAYLGELMGYTGDVQQIAVQTAAALEATGAKTLVVMNPADAQIFIEEYAKWGLLQNMQIVTITAYLTQLIDSGALKLGKADLKASVQEPVKLTRGLEEEQPLLKIVAAAGVENIEMFLHGKMSRCIGTIPFEQIAPETVREMVRVRVEDAVRMGATAMIAASADDYYILTKYAKDMQIIDLFNLLSELC